MYAAAAAACLSIFFINGRVSERARERERDEKKKQNGITRNCIEEREREREREKKCA